MLLTGLLLLTLLNNGTKIFFLSISWVLFHRLAQTQELPHRMRMGLSLDLVGNTLGVGAQLHGSFRLTDSYYFSFDDRHQYTNIGGGVGATLSRALSVGMSIPNYVTYGIGRGRAMWEFGLTGVRGQKLVISTETTPQTGQLYRTPNEHWQYLVLPLVGYRYTAYSGFMFRVNAPVPGIAFGWIF